MKHQTYRSDPPRVAGGGREARVVVRGIRDFTDEWGTTVEEVRESLRRNTGCGARIEWDDECLTISAGEGAAERKRTFRYPVRYETLEGWIDELERASARAKDPRENG